MWAWKLYEFLSIKLFNSIPACELKRWNMDKYMVYSSLNFKTRALNYVDTYSPRQTCTGCAPSYTSCPSVLRARVSSRSWWWSVCAWCGWSGFLGPPPRCSRHQSRTPGRSPYRRRWVGTGSREWSDWGREGGPHCGHWHLTKQNKLNCTIILVELGYMYKKIALNNCTV